MGNFTISWGIDGNRAVPPTSAPVADAEIPPVFLDAKRAASLLRTDAAAAEKRARDWLAARPADSDAAYVLGAALRRQDRSEEALTVLGPLTKAQPQTPLAWRELGGALIGCDKKSDAIAALIRAVDLDCCDKEAWYALGDLLNFPDSDAVADPGSTLSGLVPADARAIKLKADAALREGRRGEFEALLSRCLEIAPDFGAARFRLVTMRFADRDVRGILPHIEVLLRSEPENLLFRSLKALALFWSREFDAAIAEFESFIGRCADKPGSWLAYGQALRAARNATAITAFRKAIEIVPTYSEAHVALVNAKPEETPIEAIRASLAQPGLAAEDRVRMLFVLGRAFEHLERFPELFDNYRSSNAILRARKGSDGAHNNLYARHAKAFFTPAFFHTRAGYGCPEPDAIFIVGIPRSGTTLVEQILSSHSQVEALGEITDLPATGRRLAPDRPGDPRGGYPYVLKDLDAERCRLIGAQYLRSTRARRVFGTPFFTDKLPGNFAHVGLIQLALPNARIVDVRRHPLDSCFSCYKHYFPVEFSPAQDLAEMGRFYADYVELMAHFDEILPGKVYRVFYEDLVQDFETQVRRLLDHLALPFEDQCLRFHENSRLVLTLSADQVSTALYESGVGKWRHYEQWLEPLKKTLGPVLDAYPGVPGFSRPSRVQAQTPPEQGVAARRSSFMMGLRQIQFGTASQAIGRGEPQE